MSQSLCTSAWPQWEYATILDILVDFYPGMILSKVSFTIWFWTFGCLNPSYLLHTVHAISWCSQIGLVRAAKIFWSQVFSWGFTHMFELSVARCYTGVLFHSNIIVNISSEVLTALQFPCARGKSLHQPDVYIMCNPHTTVTNITHSLLCIHELK